MQVAAEFVDKDDLTFGSFGDELAVSRIADMGAKPTCSPVERTEGRFAPISVIQRLRSRSRKLSFCRVRAVSRWLSA